MANAAGEKSELGDKGPSQQGRAGLRLQHALPNARVVYVSATGATNVHNLAYAQRLGLWGGVDFPFASRPDFVAAVEAGGVAAMEVLARDLKALGLYAARSLSYEGVEVEIVEHALTAEQTRIYDAYAQAFQIIHLNLNEALKAANVMGDGGTLNARAKAAAKSAFESSKQRFFNYLITAMKTPTLLKSIKADLDAGRACVVQLVSTGESLMERRLAEIPVASWGDLDLDVTPRELCLEYLAKSFPTQLYELYEDEGGRLQSRPVMRDGQPVQSREAMELRDRLIEKLAALPAVQTALDQILHHFGAEKVAEVTGRTRRIVKRVDAGGGIRLAAETRPGSANLAETQAFLGFVHPSVFFAVLVGGSERRLFRFCTSDVRVKRSRSAARTTLDAAATPQACSMGAGKGLHPCHAASGRARGELLAFKAKTCAEGAPLILSSRAVISSLLRPDKHVDHDLYLHRRQDGFHHSRDRRCRRCSCRIPDSCRRRHGDHRTGLCLAVGARRDPWALAGR